MQDPAQGPRPDIAPYTSGMARKLSKPRPPQAARLVALRKAAGLSQAELARLVGEPQANIAFWERTEKPPRSDVLPKLATVLGVRIEELLDADVPRPPKPGRPVGKAQKIFNEVSKLPRRQQDKVLEVVSAMVHQYKQRKTG
jgi:transcriptional regulator with XRE-family HTH domain